jgi:hypothetical protein
VTGGNRFDADRSARVLGDLIKTAGLDVIYGE